MLDKGTSGLVVISKRTRNQRGNVEIISHALHNVSTLPHMTAQRLIWLHPIEQARHRHLLRARAVDQPQAAPAFVYFFVTVDTSLRSDSSTAHQIIALRQTNEKTHLMKRTVIALTVSGALALGTLVAIAGEHGGHGHGKMHHMMGNPLEHLTKDLDLTPEQAAKVSPIVDQAKPQIRAIHQEAMEKTRVVMENASAQIRPLLTPEQQTKFDAMKKAHEDMRKAMQDMHKARQQ